MLNGLFGPRNFYTKCKAALKMINVRMHNIMKKRNAMQKFLKNDIADLLKSNLDYNAYGRAEGLYRELNLTSCYIYVQECCDLVSHHLKAIHKESECPQECRAAVASLMHAAARFSDLPELRDVRTMFKDKYGNELDIYVSKEFVEKLKSNSPTMEMKFELMKEIANEFSIAWESTALEHKLNEPPPPQGQYTRGYKLNRTVSEDVLTKKEAKTEEMDEVRPPRPKSVRSRFTKRPENGNDFNALVGKGECDEEAAMDRLLIHYSTKPSGKKGCTNGIEAKNLESGKGTMVRSKSDSVNMNHLHPKLPDYDELATRMEALRKA